MSCLNEYLCGALIHLSIGTPLHSRKTNRSIGACVNNELFSTRECDHTVLLLPCLCYELYGLSTLCKPHLEMPLPVLLRELLRIICMQGLAKRKHHIISRIYDIVDRTLSQSTQSCLEPFWRFFDRDPRDQRSTESCTRMDVF